jgi:hypothetical protein
MLELAQSEPTGFQWFFLFIWAGVIFVLAILPLWVIFTKAGEEGWKAVIPIYNYVVLLKIIGRPWWWLLLLLIPIVGFVIYVLIMNDLSKSFGRGTGFTVGLIFLNWIFLMILAFGSARYLGPAAQAGTSGGSGSPPPPPMPSG